jgi:retinol dehydrogenase-12
MTAETAVMSGKTCLITGGTAGIGEVTALELARMGASVVILGRSAERGAATLEKIGRETGNPSVEFFQVDLSSQSDVRRVARQFLDSHDRLDVLINNAGALFTPRQESVDGIEKTLALNHLAYFLLTNLVLDRLTASAPARIVNVASDAHRMVNEFNFNDPQARKRYRPFKVYAQSKLANILFTYELARRLEGTGVTANALHPGFVASNFTAGNGVLGWFMRRAASLFAINTEQGAKTSIYVSTSPDVKSISGRYYEKEKAVTSSVASMNEESARRLWELSEELTAVSA